MDVGIDMNTPININIKEQVCVCGGHMVGGAGAARWMYLINDHAVPALKG